MRRSTPNDRPPKTENSNPAFDISSEINLRQLFGAFATGVTIVTCQDHDGARAAVTANSFTSVSMAPPLVLFCLSRSAGSAPVFERAAEFSIHVLGSHQADLARNCAAPGLDKLSNLRSISSSSRGGPRLEGALSRIDCRRYSLNDGGDHIVVMGEVVGAEIADRAMKPLVFHRGEFSALDALKI